MSSENYKRIIIYIDFMIYLFCLSGINQIIQKSDVPFKIDSFGSLQIIQDSELYPWLRGSVIRSIDGKKFLSREDLEVYTDYKNIGDPISLQLSTVTGDINYTVRTINFYSQFYIITVIITGTLFFLIAIFVLLKSSDKKAPMLFHCVVVITAVIMMTTWGNVNVRPYPLGIVLRIIFHIAYLTAPVLFLHFKLSFPLDRSVHFRKVLGVLYITGITIAVIQSFIFTQLHNTGYSSIPIYTYWFNAGRIFFIVCVITSLAVFIHSFVIIKKKDQRKKLKWLLLGYITGPAAFILLWVIPQAITDRGLLPEAVIIMLMTSIPVTFAVSILKYHILDIDLILNRSFVYSIVISLLLLLYMFLISFSIKYSGEYAKDFPVIAAIIIALIFQPVKNYIQKIVDTRFFRVNYNYRQVIKKLLQDINNCNNLITLSGKLITELNDLIPTERSAFYLFNSKEKSLSIISHMNMEYFQDKKYFLKSDEIMLHSPAAAKDSVEPETGIASSDSKLFKAFNIALVLPVKSSSGEIFAFMVFGRKKAGNRFSIEDADLLMQVASESGSTIERIYLNEKYIAEHFERTKLEELNELKSFFVSGVSHELKIPITGIKMFTEILNSEKPLDEPKRNAYFRIINGECDRLTRMIDNVLNIVKIEKGIKSYSFEITDIDEVVSEALRIMEYQLAINKFCVNYCHDPEEKLIFADKDAILEVIVNLISNSIKYSADVKEINVVTAITNNKISVAVKDKGIGIDEQNIPQIFKPYFRSEQPEAKKIAGTGLGLAIVKHVIDAHNGKIEVSSEPGMGTTMKISFDPYNEQLRPT